MSYLSSSAVILALFLASQIAVRRPDSARPIVGVPRVIDGDTLQIKNYRIRLTGIDAPEKNQLCGGKPVGRAVTVWLADLLKDKTVECRKESTDRYGRIIALCTLDGEDLSALIVRSGWAMTYRKYSTKYVPQEDAARTANLGIWAQNCLPPWEWRKNH